MSYWASASSSRPSTCKRPEASRPGGALAKALTLENPKGLLAVSSGNHAQGVAYAARILGVKALIVMPEEASPFKKEAARAYGAQVVDQGARNCSIKPQHILTYPLTMNRHLNMKVSRI